MQCVCFWLLYLIASMYKNLKICFCISVCSGVGQTNLRMPQGCFGQVCEGKQLSLGEQGVLVRWEYSYSSWTLFTCEIEMLLHVVSTAGTHTQILYAFKYVHFVETITLFTPAIDICLGWIDVLAHCERVKPILDLVHKIISTDWTVSDCLLPLTSRIYMLLQRWDEHINMKTKQCVNNENDRMCLIFLTGWPPLLTLQ